MKIGMSTEEVDVMLLDEPFELSYSSTPEEIKAALRVSKYKSKAQSSAISPISIPDSINFSRS